MIKYFLIIYYLSGTVSSIPMPGEAACESYGKLAEYLSVEITHGKFGKIGRFECEKRTIVVELQPD